MDPIIILQAGVTSGTVLLFATLGEILAERSGVLNLGVEGMMLIGAMSAFSVAVYTGNPWLGLLVAMLVNYHAIWAPIVAIFFAALSIGNTELQYIGLNSYFAGVLQGFLVLFVVLVDGLRKRLFKTR